MSKVKTVKKTKEVNIEVEEVKEVKEKVEKFKYEVKLSINDEVRVKKTNDVYETLRAEEIPEIVSGMTEIEVKNIETGTISNRSLRNFETKRLFGDDVGLRVMADMMLSEII